VMPIDRVRMYRPLGRNAFAFVTIWALAFAFVQAGQSLLGGWPASEAGQFIACALGVPIAIAIGARLAAYFWAAMAAFSASELSIHLYYGIRAAQGAPTHFAVMLAALLAIILGAALSVAPQWSVSQPRH